MTSMGLFGRAMKTGGGQFLGKFSLFWGFVWGYYKGNELLYIYILYIYISISLVIFLRGMSS